MVLDIFFIICTPFLVSLSEIHIFRFFFKKDPSDCSFLVKCWWSRWWCSSWLFLRGGARKANFFYHFFVICISSLDYVPIFSSLRPFYDFGTNWTKFRGRGVSKFQNFIFFVISIQNLVHTPNFMSLPLAVLDFQFFADVITF